MNVCSRCTTLATWSWRFFFVQSARSKFKHKNSAPWIRRPLSAWLESKWTVVVVGWFCEGTQDMCCCHPRLSHLVSPWAKAFFILWEKLKANMTKCVATWWGRTKCNHKGLNSYFGLYWVSLSSHDDYYQHPYFLDCVQHALLRSFTVICCKPFFESNDIWFLGTLS